MDALKSNGQMLDQINLGDVPRSGFDRTFNHKGTGTLGRLYPVRCEETLPGDRWQGSSTATVQFQPLAVPMMSNMYTRIETFEVPRRIVWKNWEKFITGGEKLDDTHVPPTVPFESIIQAITTQLGLRTDLPIENGSLYITLSSTSQSIGDSLYISKSAYVNWLKDVISGIESSVFAQNYQCRDLLDESLSVLRNCLANVDTQFDSSLFVDGSDVACIPVFGYTLKGDGNAIIKDVNVTTNRVISGDVFVDSTGRAHGWTTVKPGGSSTRVENSRSETTYKPTKFGSWNVATTAIDVDQYTYDLKDFLLSYVKKFYAKEPTAKAYTFSSDFFAILQNTYDSFKCVFGIGSNLDMMSAGCLGMQDYIVHCYCAAYYQLWGGNVNTNLANPIDWKLNDGYLGVSHKIDILPFRALYLIWYNYYRDQLLETSAFEPTDDDSYTEAELCALFLPRYRCWSKDTFTTALTNTGTGSMFVKVDSNAFDTAGHFEYRPLGDHVYTANDKLQGMDSYKYELSDGTTIELPTRYLSGMHTKLETPLQDGNVSGFSLDMLNRAQRMQKWLQKALIYGNRPQDAYWTHFRVKSSDARLQLPEYISGDSSLVRLDTITNNTTIGETVAGDKAANAYGYFDGMNMNRFCEEHGFIISLFSVMPELSYGYGLDRKFVRLDKFDYPWPEFAQLGMDAVYNRELVCPMVELSSMTPTGVSPSDMMELYAVPYNVFGYQGRYYDYKSKQDEIHGDLLETMDVYTFARKFSKYGSKERNKYPSLNYQFVHCHPRLDMFVNDSFGAPVFWFDIHHAQAVERVLPVPSMTV